MQVHVNTRSPIAALLLRLTGLFFYEKPEVLQRRTSEREREREREREQKKNGMRKETLNINAAGRRTHRSQRHSFGLGGGPQPTIWKLSFSFWLVPFALVLPSCLPAPDRWWLTDGAVGLHEKRRPST